LSSFVSEIAKSGNSVIKEIAQQHLFKYYRCSPQIPDLDINIKDLKISRLRFTPQAFHSLDIRLDQVVIGWLFLWIAQNVILGLK
jgi:hypothetical protein